VIRRARALFVLLILALSMTSWPAGQWSAAYAQPTTLEPALSAALAKADEDEAIRVIVRLADAEHSALIESQLREPLARRIAQRTAFVRALRQSAEASQRDLLTYLAQPSVARQVSEVKSLWAINAVALAARPAVVQALARRPDVRSVALDRWQKWIHGIPSPLAAGVLTPALQARAPLSTALEARIQSGPLDPGQTTWGIAKIGADRVWRELGVTGSGVVVANIDTGVDWNHPALKPRYRGWSGRPAADHLHNWFDATGEGAVYPSDVNGHGTHTMGTIVGEGGIGVAPGALWMAAKAFNGQGYALLSWIHAAFQFMLAPNGNPTMAPHIVSNSWGSDDGSSTAFRDDVRALRAAGIFAVFANGNRGPAAGTVGSPASLPEAIGIGASDPDDDVARFSSRGPSPFGVVRPHLVAPGVRVLSAYPGGGYVTASGTSMATPHAAGVAALLLSISSTLDITATLFALTSTAKPLSTTLPNNDSGWGRLDAYRAVLSVMPHGVITGYVMHAGQPISGAQVVAHDGTLSPSAVSDAQGRYAIVAPPGIYTVTASAFGFFPSTSPPQIVTAGQLQQVNFALALRPSGVARGIVTDVVSGRLLTQTVVSALGTPVSGRADVGLGYYVLNLPAGTYTIEARLNGYLVQTQTVTVSDGQIIEAHFALTPTQRLLFVDSGAWYYASAADHYRRAFDLLRLAYDEVRVRQVPRDTPTITTLLGYDAVIWSAPFDAPGLVGAGDAISRYLTAGGRLLLSGQDVAFYDGSWAFHPYFSRLNAVYLADDVPSRRVIGAPGTLLAGRAFSIAGGDGADNQGAVDVVGLRNADLGLPVARYQGDVRPSAWAGVYAGSCLPYRSALYAFGLEAIDTTAERAAVISRTLAAFAALSPTVGVALAHQPHPNFDLPAALPGQTITHVVRVRHIGEAGGTDTLSLTLAGGGWLAQVNPSTVTLAPCSATFVTVTVQVPLTATWDAHNALTLTATSIASPAASASVVLSHKTPAGILLVDDDRFFDKEDDYLDALAAYGNRADRWSTRGGDAAQGPPLDVLRMYPLVIWFNAYDWFSPLSAGELERLGAYLEGGGRVMLSSQAALYYLEGHPALARYFGLAGIDFTDATSNVVGAPGHAIGIGYAGGTLLTGLGGRFPYNWNLSTAVQPVQTASVVVRGDSGQPFGLAQTGLASGPRFTPNFQGALAPEQWRAVLLPWAFETLEPSARRALMNRIVGWLSWLGESSLAADAPDASPGQQVTFTLAAQLDPVRASSPLTATVSLSATLDGEGALVGSNLPAFVPPADAGSWHGVITAGQRLSWTFVAQVPTTATAGSALTATAFFSLDEVGVRFVKSASVRVGGTVLTAALELPAGAPRWGDRITVTAVLTNLGSTLAPSATLDVVVPAGPRLLTDTVTGPGTGDLRSADNRLIWRGPLNAGAAISITYAFTLPMFTPWPGAYYHAVMFGQEGGYEGQRDAWIAPQTWRRWLAIVRR
jgi:subtilisin family serine protease